MAEAPRSPSSSPSSSPGSGEPAFSDPLEHARAPIVWNMSDEMRAAYEAQRPVKRGMYPLGVNPKDLDPQKEAWLRNRIRDWYVRGYGEQDGVRRYNSMLREMGDIYGVSPDTYFSTLHPSEHSEAQKVPRNLWKEVLEKGDRQRRHVFQEQIISHVPSAGVPAPRPDLEAPPPDKGLRRKLNEAMEGFIQREYGPDSRLDAPAEVK